MTELAKEQSVDASLVNQASFGALLLATNAGVRGIPTEGHTFDGANVMIGRSVMGEVLYSENHFPRQVHKADLREELRSALQGLTEPQDRVLLAHLGTQCIHSFVDGNGRTGRFFYDAFMNNTVVSGNTLAVNVERFLKSESNSRDAIESIIHEPQLVLNHGVARHVTLHRIDPTMALSCGRMYHCFTPTIGDTIENPNLDQRTRELFESEFSEYGSFPASGLALVEFCLNHETYKECVEIREDPAVKGKKLLFVDGKRVLNTISELEAFELKSKIDDMRKQLVSDLISCFTKPQDNIYYQTFGRPFTDAFWKEMPSTGVK